MVGEIRVNKKIQINGRDIGTDFPPYIIAELSANHNGRLETALKIIEQAKICGADAIKLQTYKADTITLNSKNEEFMIRGGLWDGQSLYELYEKTHMPWEWHKPLFDYARDLDITIFNKEGVYLPAFIKTYPFLNVEVENKEKKVNSLIAIDNNPKYVGKDKKFFILDKEKNLSKEATLKVELIKKLNS